MALRHPEPDQLFDFLARRGSTGAVTDTTTLTERLDSQDAAPDQDGGFRVNSFHCNANMWGDALIRLAQSSTATLLDVRGLSAHAPNWQLRFEQLLDRVALTRVTVVADRAADTESIEERFTRHWDTLAGDSPNQRTERPTLRFLHVESQSSREVEALLLLLFDAAAETDVQGVRKPATLHVHAIA